MPTKIKINLLFVALYLAGFGDFLLSSIFSLENFSTVLLIAIDLILISIAISFLSFRSKYNKYLIVFLTISSITYLLNSESSILFHLHGLREILIIICLFIIFEKLYKSYYIDNIINRFKLFTYLFLGIQIPVSFIQYLKYGPGDFVGGTLGKGGSGVLTFSIFILIYLIMELKSNTESIKEKITILLFHLPFFIPVVLNETKITFLLILILFLSLINLKKLGTSTVAAGIGIVMLLIFSALYSTQEKRSFVNPLTGIYSKEFISTYLSGQGDEFTDVPRITKLALGSSYLYQKEKLSFGQSYSLFKEGKVHKSDFYRKFEWLLIGSRPYIFYLLFSGGIALVLLVLFLVYSEMKFNRFEKSVIKNRSFNFFLFCVFTIILFYNDGLRFQLLSFIFVFCLFYSKRDALKLSTNHHFIS